MELLYQNILNSMSRATRGKKLAKAILNWVTCGIRPLLVDELDGALKFNIKDGFPKITRKYYCFMRSTGYD